jgi:hypothetical protein
MKNNLKNSEDDKEYIIFASDYENEKTVALLKERGIGYKHLNGRYKGVDETSFIIAYNDLHKIEDLIKKQESVLWLDAMGLRGRRAALIYGDRKEQPQVLGYFKEVTEKGAKKKDSYTQDRLTGLFYTCE